MPQISVIVPVYKVEPYLHRCVDSILNQTFKDFELILVDDGSPDGCPAICDAYGKQDSRVHVIHQPNGGLSAARNTGIDWAFANSDSEWITFVDSDDWIATNMLSCFMRTIQENGVELCIVGLVEISTVDDLAEEIPLQISRISLEELYRLPLSECNPVSACGKLYRKKQWEQIRFPIGKLHEDRFTTHKLICQNQYLVNIAKPFYFCYSNPNSITRSAWTPARLDDLEAVQEQLKYFQSKGLHQAWLKTAASHLWLLRNTIDAIDQISPQYRDIQQRLRIDLRKALKHYHYPLKITLKNYSWAYEKAYPETMQLYWLWQAVLKKLGIEK